MTNYNHLYKTAAVSYFSNQVHWQVSHISDIHIQKLTAVYSTVDYSTVTYVVRDQDENHIVKEEKH